MNYTAISLTQLELTVVVKVIALLSEEGDEMCARGPDREWITQAEEKGESGL